MRLGVQCVLHMRFQHFYYNETFFFYLFFLKRKKKGQMCDCAFMSAYVSVWAFVCISAVPDRMAQTVVTLPIIAIIIGYEGYPKCVCAWGYCVYLWMHLAYVLAQTTISTTIKPITMGHWGHPALHWTVQSHHHHQTHYQANHITLYFNTLCVLHLNKLFHNKKGGKL